MDNSIDGTIPSASYDSIFSGYEGLGYVDNSIDGTIPSASYDSTPSYSG